MKLEGLKWEPYMRPEEFEKFKIWERSRNQHDFVNLRAKCFSRRKRMIDKGLLDPITFTLIKEIPNIKKYNFINEI